MNSQNLFKEDSFRNFITISMPGYFSTWPILILILQTHKIQTENIETIITIIWTVFSFGIGMILEDLGGRMELILEKQTKINQTELLYYWRRYLLLSDKNDVFTSKMMKYISSVVTRLKFECSMAIALVIMIILITMIQAFSEPIFSNACTLVIVIIFSLISVYYLYIEAKSSIDVLHSCRKRLVDQNDYPNDPKNMNDEFTNQKFSNYKA